MTEEGRSTGAPPRWLADEMLGRLARYLRFVGHDAEYVRGLADADIRRRAIAEHRTLLTRDRDLAASTPGSLLLTSPEIAEQFRQVHRAFPRADWEVRFDRCSLCNAPLHRWTPPSDGTWPIEVPKDLVAQGLEIYECPECRQRYWEGSHSRKIRQQIADWRGGPSP